MAGVRALLALLIPHFRFCPPLPLSGPLVAYLQADILLTRFSLCTQKLDLAVGSLPLEELDAPEETREECHATRALMQRTTFNLQQDHLTNLCSFRDAVSNACASAPLTPPHTKHSSLEAGQCIVHCC